MRKIGPKNVSLLRPLGPRGGELTRDNAYALRFPTSSFPGKRTRTFTLFGKRGTIYLSLGGPMGVFAVGISLIDKDIGGNLDTGDGDGWV